MLIRYKSLSMKDNIPEPLSKGLEYLREIIYPRRCPVCTDIIVPKGEKICKDCINKLVYISEPFCKKCGKPIQSEEKEYCFDCTHKSLHFKYGRALFLYDNIMKDSIAGFKFQGKKEYADFYAEEIVKVLGDYIRYISPEVLVPVPIHRRKKRVRGFNQAELLAKKIGNGLNISVTPNLLIRNKNTIPQKELNDKERLRNLEKAFEINENDLSVITSVSQLGKVMLIDDIYTTGSTIEACTKLLLSYGFKEVYFICLCIGKGY